MSDAPKCNDCGVDLTDESPVGLCPACMIKLAYESGKGLTDDNSSKPPTTGWPHESKVDLAELSELFPELEIVEELGQGGMGVVVLARQKNLDRAVALKLLKADIASDPTFAERFTREARALAKLSHSAIIGIHDFGQREHLYYFLMEYVDGSDLRRIVKEGQLQPSEALAIVPQICDALQYAHDMGVVHRDIKPENILIDKSGRVKIADFGLAKLIGQDGNDFTLTGTRQVMGTPHYMAPEQMEQPHNVDHRADIYSLGVVFYEMLTGELPIGRFAAPSEKVEVNVRLDEVVLRALAKEPDRRYQQVTDVKTRVEAIGDAKPGVAKKAIDRVAGWVKQSRNIEWAERVAAARTNLAEGTKLAANGASVAGAYSVAAGEFAASRSRRFIGKAWEILGNVWRSIRSTLGWMVIWTLLCVAMLGGLGLTWLPKNAWMEYHIFDRSAKKIVPNSNGPPTFKHIEMSSSGFGTFRGINKQAKFMRRTRAAFTIYPLEPSEKPQRLSVRFNDGDMSFRFGKDYHGSGWSVLNDSRPFEVWMKSAGIAQSDLMKRQASSLFEISQSLAEDGGVLDSDAHLAPRFVSFDKIRIDAPPQLQAMADLVDDDLFIIASSAGVTAEFRPNDLTFVVVAIAIVGSLGIGYATILYLGYRRWRYG